MPKLTVAAVNGPCTERGIVACVRDRRADHTPARPSSATTLVRDEADRRLKRRVLAPPPDRRAGQGSRALVALRTDQHVLKLRASGS